jgi:hypothetical protein
VIDSGPALDPGESFILDLDAEGFDGPQTDDEFRDVDPRGSGRGSD